MKFSELDLHPRLQENLAKINFSECTPIQEMAIPILLAGKDLAGLAQTGTGKTAAFLLPLIDRILKGMEQRRQLATETVTEPASIQETAEAKENADAGLVEKPHHYTRFFEDWRPRQFVMVLVPTRELAEQVAENAALFIANTPVRVCSIYGGTSYDKQKSALRDGVEIVVATPGRLIDLFKEHLVDMRQVRAIVFDEADRMFDMGFKDDMKFILRRVPRDRQFLVFSATLNFDVLNVAYEFGAQPIEINVSKDQAKAENVDDEIFHVGQGEKPSYLLSIFKKYQPRQAIVFTNYKHSVERIAQFLSRNGYPAMGISSLLSQAQRNRVMEQFKSENDRNILVATDVAARGLDILGVDMVVNYDLPEDAENYVHRIGRTGRAGNRGRAYSLSSDRDVESLGRIEEYLGNKLPIAWMENEDLIKDFKPFPEDRDLGFKRRSGPATPSREDRQRFKQSGSRPPRRDDRPRRDEGGRPQQRSARHHDRPRGDRPQGEQRPQGDRGRGIEAQTSRGEHRDRRMGRHASRPETGRSHHGGRQQTSSGASPARHASSQSRSHSGSRTRTPSSSSSAARRNPSIGQRVTKFFKKMFGN